MDKFVKYCAMIVERFGGDFQSKEELTEGRAEVEKVAEKAEAV